MKAVIAVVAAALLGTGCNASGGGDSVVKLKASLTALTSAKGAIVAPKGGKGGSLAALQVSGITSGPPQALYTLNADGTLTETTVVEGEDGSTSSTVEEIQPLAVFDTPAYVVVAYEGLKVSGDTPCPFVLARRTDGALFCVPVGSIDRDGVQRGGASYRPILQSNAAGDLIWVNGPSLARVDLTDPASPNVSNPVDQQALTGGRHFDSLVVNARGDALLTFSFDSNQTRVQRANGGFQNLTTSPTQCASKGFAGNPNDFFIFEDKRATKYVDGTPFTKVDIGALPDTGDINAYFDCRTGLVRTSDALLTAAARTLVKVSNTAVQSFAVPTLSKVTAIHGSTSAVMLLGTDSAGNSGIVKFDLATSAFMTLLTPGEYAISSMVVAPSGETTFQGQRASDGADILGNIAAGSTQVDIVATGFPKVIDLIRLN